MDETITREQRRQRAVTQKTVAEDMIRKSRDIRSVEYWESMRSYAVKEIQRIDAEEAVE